MYIGIAGVGRMGAAIASRLMELGHTIAVWNRTAEKCKPLAAAGATVAATAGEMAGRCDVIITILTDAAAIDRVYRDPTGILSADLAGKLVIEMSTVRPEIEIALAKVVAAKGAGFVECPVGGTAGPAREGKLIGVMGAAPDDAARAKPILDQLCRRLEHCGPVGSGALMKLAINLPLMVYWQALGEALALCRPVGVDPDRLIGLLAETSGGPNILKSRGPLVAKSLKAGQAGEGTFDIDGCLKDLRSMLAEARARGLDLPLVERTLACYEEVARQGLGGKDASGVSLYWSTRN